MPLHIDIRLNEKVIDQIHIGRVERLNSTDQVSHYQVVHGIYDDWAVPWDTGTPFTHKYDEGGAVCVQKAFAALDLGASHE